MNKTQWLVLFWGQYLNLRSSLQNAGVKPPEGPLLFLLPEGQVTAGNLRDACSFGCVSLWLGIFQIFHNIGSV